MSHDARLKRSFQQVSSTENSTSTSMFHQHVLYSTKLTHAYEMMRHNYVMGSGAPAISALEMGSFAVHDLDNITCSAQFQHVAAGEALSNAVFEQCSSKFQAEEASDRKQQENIHKKQRDRQKVDLMAVGLLQKRSEEAHRSAEELLTVVQGCVRALDVNIWWTGKKKAGEYFFQNEAFSAQHQPGMSASGVPCGDTDEMYGAFPYGQVETAKFINLSKVKEMDLDLHRQFESASSIQLELDRAVKARVVALANLSQTGPTLTLDGIGDVDTLTLSGKCQDMQLRIQAEGQQGIFDEQQQFHEECSFESVLAMQRSQIGVHNVVLFVRPVLELLNEMREYMNTRRRLGIFFYCLNNNLTVRHGGLLEQLVRKLYLYDGGETAQYQETRVEKIQASTFGEKSTPFKPIRSNLEESLFGVRQLQVKLSQEGEDKKDSSANDEDDWPALESSLQVAQEVIAASSVLDPKQRKLVERKVNAVVGKISANQTSMRDGLLGLAKLAFSLYEGLTVSGVTSQGAPAVQYMLMQVVAKLTDPTVDHPSLIFCNAYLLTGFSLLFPSAHPLALRAMTEQCFWVAPRMFGISSIKKRQLKFQEKTLESGQVVLECIEEYLQRQQHCLSLFYAYISTPTNVGEVLCSGLPNLSPVHNMLSSATSTPTTVNNADKMGFQWTHIARVCNSREPTIVTPLLLQLFTEFAGSAFINAFRAPAAALLELIHRKIQPWLKTLPKESIGGEDGKAALAVLFKMLQDSRVPHGYALQKHTSAEIAGEQHSEVRRETLDEFDRRAE